MLKHVALVGLLAGVGALVPREAQEAKLVNLARTSLARVEASEVNGERPMDCPYYGVLNAFDGGQNRIGGLPYPYWLASASGEAWVRVRFDEPVQVASLIVLDGPWAVARLTCEDGRVVLLGEGEVAPEGEDGPEERRGVGLGAIPPRVGQGDRQWNPARPVESVLEVELAFRSAEPMALRVDEILVLGQAPTGLEYQVSLPRVELTPRTAALVADAAFLDWLAPLLKDKPRRTRETASHWIHTYQIEGVPVMRVTVHKTTGERTVETLAPGAPLSEDSAD